MRKVASPSDAEILPYGWFTRALVERPIWPGRPFSVVMKEAFTQVRSSRLPAGPDARMPQEIGPEPFDAYYG